MGVAVHGRKHDALAGFGQNEIHETASDCRGDRDCDKGEDDYAKVLLLLNSGDDVSDNQWLSKVRASAYQAENHGDSQSASVFF